MTTPQQPPPPPQQNTAQEAALVVAIGTALITATSAAVALGSLLAYLPYARIPRQAMFAALDIVMRYPPGQTGFYGPATMAMERMNLQRRSAFVVAAARRIGVSLKDARSRGESQTAALARAVQQERRFYGQHLIATWQRSQAGAQVDSAAMVSGLLLGWHTTRDTRTSADCLAANGKNFYADHMPVIGYPGAVHPHCRCQAGTPFPGARLLRSYGLPAARKYQRAA